MIMLKESVQVDLEVQIKNKTKNKQIKSKNTSFKYTSILPAFSILSLNSPCYLIFHTSCLNIFLHKKNLAKTYFHMGHPHTIFSYLELNCRVRNGNGCVLGYIFTRNVLYCILYNTLKNIQQPFFNLYWLSPRSISTGQLHTLLHLHPQPIKHMCLYVILLD